MIRNNIIYPYLIFFTFILIIIFTLNFFYKKYVVNLKIDQRYSVSATQLYDFKSKSLGNTLDKVFSNINRKYLIEKKTVEKFNATLNKTKSRISFILITRKNHDMSAKQIEKEINNYYLGSINKIIKDIENNLHLFDFQNLREQYNQEKKSIDNIKIKYDNLVNSDFFKEYPPAECKNDILHCFKKYAAYYSFIFKMIEKDSKNFQVIETLRLKNSSKKTTFEIFEDFYLNRNLFYFEDIILQAENSNKITMDEINFLSKKYEEFKRTSFYADYIFGDYYCKSYSEGCFKNVSLALNKTLYEHKREANHPFKVEFIPENIGINNYVLKDAPIVLGLTSVITYIFFILTNKFFRRKLK